ncbi:hypothetical protein HPB48_016525 [Haemaphysalis longicornis]|uniref:Nuclease HARBI1 n=1 Tax=Haemaphysalis longicornis TaxID=44386 RepID=A0A9J6GW39_HAELO|nr:hypothetical protein HPB48_016525 [Haemaphysalis longicornis]
MAVHLPLVFASLVAQKAQQAPRRQLRWPRRQHTPRDAFALSDEEFVRKFRLAKSAVHTLCGGLRDRLEPQRAGGLSTETKALCALRFFATGSYQNLVGSDESVGVSQASVSRCVRTVSTAIVAVGTEKGWVQFPTTAEERRRRPRRRTSYGSGTSTVSWAASAAPWWPSTSPKISALARPKVFGPGKATTPSI